MFEAGKQFGRYQIRSQLGAGGMGEVFLAEDAELQRFVALKILPDEFSKDAERLRRFIGEARAASALNHPNILTIYEIGTANDSRFIASEFIKGETLRRKIRNLSLAETLDVAVQIASALEAAHNVGIVHRDIKPENIMIRPDGLVKILDFGIAKLTEKKAEPIEVEAATAIKAGGTSAGMIIGTANYMSPEQARGKTVDARSDIFSFGIVLYEMLSGKPPFDGENVLDVIGSILHKEPAPLDSSEMPNDLQRIVAKCLRKNCDERYQTADLLVDLRDFKQELEFQNKLERTAQPSPEETKTQILNVAPVGETQSSAGIETNAAAAEKRKFGLVVSVLALFLAAVGGLGIWYFAGRAANTKQIESIAVMPFVNDSGNADAEYLSDGMTETLISSLSQIPKLNVKARSSVFRYKGKETDAQTVGKELNVQAILTGRVVQRGNDLILYVELVDAATENSLWKQTYNKTMTNLVALQNDIARDVADKLKVKLSGADEQRLAKNYTENPEAYQLYLRGRYHYSKLTSPEMQKSIFYLQQAIEVDPGYALAYAGLSDAYRSFAIAGDMQPTEFLPKAKAAANKAIELDDTLAEAHIALGVAVFWSDWNWKAAENQYKRALELNPTSADAYLYYAHLFSVLGRHTEALAEVKLARELEPLNLRINALEGQFLTHAGRSDEALARFHGIFELDPDFWLARTFAASAYIEKGMFAEAVAEARRARELFDGSSQPMAFEGYALARSGRRAEAEAVLDELLKLSTTRYVTAYHIALVYNGLNKRDETLAWLERAYEQRNPRMVFLNVEPKWNNLRDEPRFQELLRKVGFPL